MIHGCIQGSGCFNVFHQVQVFLNLDEAVKRTSRLEICELRLSHHRTAHPANDFASSDWFAREHPLAADARLSKFNSGIFPGLRRVILHGEFTSLYSLISSSTLAHRMVI